MSLLLYYPSSFLFSDPSAAGAERKGSQELGLVRLKLDLSSGFAHACQLANNDFATVQALRCQTHTVRRSRPGKRSNCVCVWMNEENGTHVQLVG